MTRFGKLGGRTGLVLAALATAIAPIAAAAQVQSIDPNRGMAADPARTAPAGEAPGPTSYPPAPAPAAGTTPALPADNGPLRDPATGAGAAAAPRAPGECWGTPIRPGMTNAASGGTPGNGPGTNGPGTNGPATNGQATPGQQAQSATYHEDDLIGAASDTFGKGAKGIAQMIRSILKKQGEPNGYISGREAGAAIVVGLRYGSGTLCHKVEGKRAVYWTGPSIGFDAGASGGSTFVLVYNLYDTEDLFKRFPAGEGQAYVIGGLNASYLRSGGIVLIPIRLGVGLRLGVNGGYMKFSRKQNWVPF